MSAEDILLSLSCVREGVLDWAGIEKSSRYFLSWSMSRFRYRPWVRRNTDRACSAFNKLNASPKQQIHSLSCILGRFRDMCRCCRGDTRKIQLGFRVGIGCPRLRVMWL